MYIGFSSSQTRAGTHRLMLGGGGRAILWAPAITCANLGSRKANWFRDLARDDASVSKGPSHNQPGQTDRAGGRQFSGFRGPSLAAGSLGSPVGCRSGVCARRIPRDANPRESLETRVPRLGFWADVKKNHNRLGEDGRSRVCINHPGSDRKRRRRHRTWTANVAASPVTSRETLEQHHLHIACCRRFRRHPPW